MAGKCRIKFGNIRVVEAGFHHRRFQVIVADYLWYSAKFLESMFMRTDKMMPVGYFSL